MWKKFLFLLLGFFLFPRPVRGADYQLDRPLGIELLENGDLLVTDGGGRDWNNQGSEIFILGRDGEVKWHFDQGLVFAHSAHVFDGDKIVITDTTNDRMVVVGQKNGQIIWTSDRWSEGTGELSDGSHLDYPNEALPIEGRRFLVTDRNNDRILEIDNQGKIYWQFNQLNRPHNAGKIDQNRYLVSDSEGNRVLMINRQGQVLWEFEGGNKPLDWPRDVKFLENGHFLITDTRNHRVLEVSESKEIVWEYREDLYWPYEAERLADGKTLVTDSQNRRVVEVNPEGQIVWELRLDRPQELADFINGGFEKETDRQPEGWIKADLLAEGEGKFGIDEKIVHSGEKSARLDYDGQGHIFWLQKVKINPGENYSFTGWVKTDLESDSDTWARYELWWETERGGFVDPSLTSEKSFGETDWVKREWTGSAPRGAVAVNIRALMTGQGTAWFDEVSWGENRGKNWWPLVIGFGVVVGGGLMIRFLL